MSRFCWGAKGSRKRGVRAVFGYHNFGQSPIEYHRIFDLWWSLRENGTSREAIGQGSQDQWVPIGVGDHRRSISLTELAVSSGLPGIPRIEALRYPWLQRGCLSLQNSCYFWSYSCKYTVNYLSFRWKPKHICAILRISALCVACLWFFLAFAGEVPWLCSSFLHSPPRFTRIYWLFREITLWLWLT